MTDAANAAGPRSRETVPGRALQDAAWREADLMHAQLRREIPGLRADSYLARQGTRRVETTQVAWAMGHALAGLCGELAARSYRATLITRGGRWRPSLVVSNPETAIRTTEIIAESGWYWWPAARRLCQDSDLARAARLIIHVLHTRCDCD